MWQGVTKAGAFAGLLGGVSIFIVTYGNVIDLGDGFAQAVLRLEKKYGSSGGIEDDPLAELKKRSRARAARGSR